MFCCAEVVAQYPELEHEVYGLRDVRSRLTCVNEFIHVKKNVDAFLVDQAVPFQAQQEVRAITGVRARANYIDQWMRAQQQRESEAKRRQKEARSVFDKHDRLEFEWIDSKTNKRAEFLYRSDEQLNTASTNAGNEKLWVGGSGLNGFFKKFLSEEQGVPHESLNNDYKTIQGMVLQDSKTKNGAIITKTFDPQSEQHRPKKGKIPMLPYSTSNKVPQDQKAMKNLYLKAVVGKAGFSQGEYGSTCSAYLDVWQEGHTPLLRKTSNNIAMLYVVGARAESFVPLEKIEKCKEELDSAKSSMKQAKDNLAYFDGQFTQLAKQQNLISQQQYAKRIGNLQEQKEEKLQELEEKKRAVTVAKTKGQQLYRIGKAEFLKSVARVGSRKCGLRRGVAPLRR